MSRRLLASYVALALLVLVALEVPLAIQFARNEKGNLTAKVERDAQAFASLSEDALEGRGPIPPLAAVARRYRGDTGGRVVIVGRHGATLVDTNPRSPGDRNFANRPEIARALTGSVATGERYSHTLGANLLYVAVPVASGGVVHGAVRITYPTSAVDSRVHRYWLTLVAIAAVVVAGASVLGLYLSRWITRPLADVKAAAVAVGDGDLTVRAPEDGPPEVRLVAGAFNDTVGKLELLLRSQEAFVADASHQLRTPLTALRLRLENLERDLSADRRGELEAAQAEVARLARLVDGLLALARAEQPKPVPKPLDVARAVGGRVDAWQAYASEREVELVSRVADGLAARATRDHLEQVLDNLLANALDVAPAGSRVTVSAGKANGWVELRVSDRGPGLSEDERQRAFDRFWRAGSADGGSGLGLAIVQRLVAADGGEAKLLPGTDGGLDAVVRFRVA